MFFLSFGSQQKEHPSVVCFVILGTAPSTPFTSDGLICLNINNRLLMGLPPTFNKKRFYYYIVNKNNENNVLCGNIGNVTVNELIEGKLIEIEVTAYKTGYSVKTRLNLNYRKK